MTQYTRKPTTVEAYRYDRQPQKDWPQWLQDYRATTNMGLIPVGSFGGVMNLPQKHGPTVTVGIGEWVVLENGVLTAWKDEAFKAAFDGFEGEAEAEAPATETASADTAPAPATETPAADAPVSTETRTSRSRKAGGSEDAPAADAEA